MKTKKGAIEVSFNWLFVLIAGAIILLFFISLVNTQREKSETNIALTIKTELKSILTGASLSESRQLAIDLPKVDLKFICEFDECDNFDISDSPSCYSQYEIGATGINEQTPSQIIFAPAQIVGKKILTWTLPWNVPFYVTNFLYITGTNVKYIFVNDGAEAIKLHNEFPQDTNKVLVNQNKLRNEESEGNSNFKFIFTSIDPSSAQHISGHDSFISGDILSAVLPENINAIKVDRDLKQITFYNVENGFFVLDEYTSYITDSEIYAAIFSDNIDFYSCNMQKAFNRLYLIAKVLSGRSNKLENDPSIPQRCSTIFNTYNNGLNQIQMESKIFSDISIQNINNNINFLRNANHQSKERSCALIY